MYLELPIISFGEIYNQITMEFKGIYFHDDKELTQLIQNLDRENLSQISYDMYSIAKRRYCWDVIAQKYAGLATGEAKQPVPVFDFELPVQLKETLN